ncbi:MAG: hypothetical protein ACR2MP_33995, partial [Streptosporangiaceae bacterium]
GLPMPLTDEDIVRDLLHRGTPQLNLPASMATEVVARQRRRDRRGRIVSVAATGVALGTAAGVVALAPGHSGAPGRAVQTTNPASPARPALKLTAAQRVLGRLSSAAAGQPAGRGRYVVMTTEGSDNGVINVKNTAVLDGLTGDLWEDQKGSDGLPSGAGSVSRHFSPTAAQFAAMPTGLTALRAALIAQWDAQNPPMDGSALRRLEKLRHPSAFDRQLIKRLRILPAKDLKPAPISDGDKVFQQVGGLLWNPLIGPELRAAMFRVLAATPGVRVNPSAHDMTGRPAVKISRTDTTGWSNNRSDGITYAMYQRPVTGAVLETTVTYPPGSDIVTPQDPTGMVTDVSATVYLSITRSGTVPPDPYGG